ncbi:magnesium transporter [Porcipelethomonas ammoniilytica]|jgi:magnesium transporter|uniref:magnesium transporter n=1 Tax=Porcipelethomonas TaxID=2981643 RepID=UPI0008205B24|nr:magnesium transporter [Porcipelethomonas ammoniilytica]MBS6315027.1 magnesium transporter [Ruminococcus sp.]MEE0185186.1 magnesium transporter [Oscillospiraceae bacterium]OLA68644.1 MAG: magnesium transporter [Ruminococcus sp. 37_24]SCI50669.1 Magnesium transporter mgtE [uncultured Ruminococcus sp.]MCU6718413.1 magnesium transporter [Porcipelethomonas ammoniilytica]
MTEKILELLNEKNYVKIKSIVKDLYPADLASLLETLSPRNITLLFRLLPKELAAETFTFMDSDTQMHLISGFSDKELREILDEIFVDDTVDIIEEMPANVVSRILKNTDAETRKQINAILDYPTDSAGSVMTTEYVYLHKNMTTKEALDWIRKVGVVKETIYTCYITESRKLIGFVTILDLVTADEDATIESIMDSNVKFVYTHEDREDVAKKFSKYDFLAMPVVDNEERMVGIITFDDVLDVIAEENEEDFSKMAAMQPIEDSYFKTSVFTHAKKRIGWLLVLMLSATITGNLLTKYEEAFQAIPILVSFIPMLMSTGGNCGSQSSTTVIRGLATGEIQFKDFFKAVFKEFRISLIISVILAVTNGLRIFIFYKNLQLSIVITLSIIGTVIIAEFIGCALPLIAKKVKLDPAIMATPLISTIVDTCSMLIYFQFATMIFSELRH